MICSIPYCEKETKKFKRCLFHRRYHRRFRAQWYKDYPEKLKESRRTTKLWQENVRKTVFQHYGNSCICCGESEPQFLSLDHINNDGAQHRRSIGRKASMGLNFYRWLIKEQFPAIVQTLCMNCNHGKSRNRGICPHLVKGLRLVA